MPTEKFVDNKKLTTEYAINDDGKKVKIVRTFEIIKKQVPKAVAQRKALAKFGMSRNDRPGILYLILVIKSSFRLGLQFDSISFDLGLGLGRLQSYLVINLIV